MSSKSSIESKSATNEPTHHSPISRHLRQVDVLLSGVQPWSRRVISSNGTNSFAYSSTSAVYIYDLHTCTIKKLISAHDGFISGVSWPPSFSSLLVTCSVDSSISVWDVIKEKRVYNLVDKERDIGGIRCIDCAHGSPLQIIFGISNRVYEWIPSQGKRRQIIKGGGSNITVVQWNPTLRRGDLVAIGRSDGRVDIVAQNEKGIWKEHPMTLPDKSKGKSLGGVLDIRWDPLSHIYILVLYGSGTVAIWDTDNIRKRNGVLVSMFEQSGTRGIAWMPWEPGNFMTVGNKSGVISVWNVSSVEAPLSTSRTSSTPFCFLQRVIDRLHPGILTTSTSSNYTAFTSSTPSTIMEASHLFSSASFPLSSMSNNSIKQTSLVRIDRAALCSFLDGSIGLLDLDRKKVAWKSFAGHRETIFDVSYHPICANILATGSYDGTVKIWNTNNFHLLGTCVVKNAKQGQSSSQQRDTSSNSGENGLAYCNRVPPSIVYSVSWKSDGSSLCIGVSDGHVQTWNIDLNHFTATSKNMTDHWEAMQQQSCNVDGSGSFNRSNTSSSKTAESSATDKTPSRKRPRCSLRSSKRLHQSEVYSVDWSPATVNDPTLEESEGIIASVSKSGRLILSTASGTILCSYVHRGGIVFGCSWNRNASNLLATTCQDGVVRILEHTVTGTRGSRSEVQTLRVLHKLIGHKSSSFRVTWNPHHSDVLASGSNDCTVRVWDINSTTGRKSTKEKTVAVLKGHTERVRALLWSHEFPEILLSGSWDSTIRIWNTVVDGGICLQIVRDHHADVYGLASHPHRPFIMVSCSRDSTLRVWRMDSPSVIQHRIHSLLGLKWDQRVLSENTGNRKREQ
jgi:WD40 repeat protein